MAETVTIDGYLARDVDGGEFALALDEESIGSETVEALITFGFDNHENDIPEWKVLGRSALGIVAGIDISKSDRPAVSHGDSLIVPINIDAYGKLGQLLLPRLTELVSCHDAGQPLRWEGHRMPFGRLLHRGGLEQLDDNGLDEALDQFLIASGDYPDQKGDVVITDDTLSLPIEPWRLVQDEALFSRPNALRLMLQEGVSARSIAFKYMQPERIDSRNRLSGVLVGAVLFAPGPYYCEVVEAVSPEGILPQIPSAAWLDAGRSRGLHSEQPQGHRGRQVEVLINPEIDYTWMKTRVSIRVYRPTEGSDQDHLVAWKRMSDIDRQDKHYFGY